MLHFAHFLDMGCHFLFEAFLRPPFFFAEAFTALRQGAQRLLFGVASRIWHLLQVLRSTAFVGMITYRQILRTVTTAAPITATNNNPCATFNSSPFLSTTRLTSMIASSQTPIWSL